MITEIKKISDVLALAMETRAYNRSGEGTAHQTAVELGTLKVVNSHVNARLRHSIASGDTKKGQGILSDLDLETLE